jgi:D-glycero-D-manno-heptose 1,7-bisphosphate phosphatase
VKRRGAFLDRDGVINVDKAYVSRAEDFEFVPGVFDAARRLRELGFGLIVVTNQSGIGRGLYDEDQFAALTAWMRTRFEKEGVAIDAVYFCPHHPTEALPAYRMACDCRKPAPGMFLKAAAELGLDLSASALFGDSESDLEAARSAGVGMRVLLGINGAERPFRPTDRGLATACYASLRDAVYSRQFAAFAEGE